jgi:hypothetical protein
VAKSYHHSAYWYAFHYGASYSEERTYSGRYLDMHTYRPRATSRRANAWTMANLDEVAFSRTGKHPRRPSAKELDSTFNPFIFATYIAIDIGLALRDEVRRFADPVAREQMKRELLRDLRQIRRPFYYARETARRRELARERRKIRRRSTMAEMPTPEEILTLWEQRKESQEAMIRLGGRLHDLECYVDNCLKFDEKGDVVGRNGGIRGWLKENLPDLAPKYKTLMRYKALAVRLRQATGTKDPVPTEKLLVKPYGEVVENLFAETEPIFSHVFARLEFLISEETVFLDAPKDNRRRRSSVRIGR